MSEDIGFKKKDLHKIISDGNERELGFLMLYWVYEKDAYSNLVIKKADKTASEAGKKIDFARAMLYGTLTYTYLIDFLIRHITREDVETMDPVARTAIRMAVWQIQFGNNIPAYAAVDASVEITKKYHGKAAGYVNAVLRKFADSPEDKRCPDQFKPGIQAALKPEIYGIFKKDYGKQTAFEIGKAFLEPMNLTVRFDCHKVDQDTLIEELRKEGITAVKGGFIPDCVEITGGLNGLENTVCFNKYGMFVQGQGAMLASHIAHPRVGDKILDCCAAPGGKSTHMAQMCRDDLKIVSVDVNESRLKLVRDNCARLGLTSVVTLCADASKINKDDKNSRKTYDIVLCDVPCSGLGLLGRKPDIREKFTYDELNELIPLQYSILDHAAKMVRPGGTLVYCTCTLNKDENEDQVVRFLAEHKRFHTVPIDKLLPEDIYMDDERAKNAANGMITLLPHLDKCEGFFICRMERDRKDEES
ncbi:MAG: 16S rRNA (cytosine(967)-C(5))-methyltransferase RsmB [Saccharofermentans sp.]|nr:16S rRNA (cytosine(967)-C(5))-methyltransferase RsmB [Saccharofermentans sp.]